MLFVIWNILLFQLVNGCTKRVRNLVFIKHPLVLWKSSATTFLWISLSSNAKTSSGPSKFLLLFIKMFTNTNNFFLEGSICIRRSKFISFPHSGRKKKGRPNISLTLSLLRAKKGEQLFLESCIFSQLRRENFVISHSVNFLNRRNYTWETQSKTNWAKIINLVLVALS